MRIGLLELHNVSLPLLYSCISLCSVDATYIGETQSNCVPLAYTARKTRQSCLREFQPDLGTAPCLPS
jgi:hypothetical protein